MSENKFLILGGGASLCFQSASAIDMEWPCSHFCRKSGRILRKASSYQIPHLFLCGRALMLPLRSRGFLRYRSLLPHSVHRGIHTSTYPHRSSDTVGCTAPYPRMELYATPPRNPASLLANVCSLALRGGRKCEQAAGHIKRRGIIFLRILQKILCF